MGSIFLEWSYWSWRPLRFSIQKVCSEHNGEKQYEQIIGTTMVYVACSNNPFKLEDEITLYSFLGQVRDSIL